MNNELIHRRIELAVADREISGTGFQQVQYPVYSACRDALFPKSIQDVGNAATHVWLWSILSFVDIPADLGLVEILQSYEKMICRS